MIKLFHISEHPDIAIFQPRPSPSYFENIQHNVVFAIEDKMLHNYLLPRDCPRVGYYLHSNTTTTDRKEFIGESEADFIINVETGWYELIMNATLFCYEFPTEDFILLDKIAGYYISDKPATPLSVTTITDCLSQLRKRNVELRFVSSLLPLAEKVKQSTLNFSLIRMRNAK